VATRKPRKRQRPKTPLVRAGMPAKDSVKEIVTKVSPTGMRFRILKTTEMDSYDKPAGGRRRGK
jgi:hypothetical protein